jgi:predicted hotdog family 3-hydroxylacyl-ACP dehydratase
MTNYLIEDLIPHRNGMRLIDDIIAVDTSLAVTQARVKADWPLITLQGAGPLLLIELAAQTAGVCFGYNELQKPVELRNEAKGWLVGIKKATFFSDDIRIGECITTHAETVMTVEHYKEVVARAFLEKEPVAEIHLQVLQAQGV